MRLAAQVRMAAQAWMWEAWMREAQVRMGPSVRVWLTLSLLKRCASGITALSETLWAFAFLLFDSVCRYCNASSLL